MDDNYNSMQFTVVQICRFLKTGPCKITGVLQTPMKGWKERKEKKKKKNKTKKKKKTISKTFYRFRKQKSPGSSKAQKQDR